MKSALLLLSTVALLGGLAGPAFADRPSEYEGGARELPGGAGETSAGLTVLGITDGRSGDPRALDDDLGGNRAGSVEQPADLVTTEWRPTGTGCPGDPTPRGTEEVHQVYTEYEIDRSTDPPTETILGTECFLDGEAPEPDSPTEPPTLDEIRQAVAEHIPAPGVHTSPPPQFGGITGLEIWFWYEGPEEVVAEAAVRGYAVTATLSPSRFYWDPCGDFQPTSEDNPGYALGCPRLLESVEPGREPASGSDGAAAAARWVYETKGHYVIRHQVVWDGSWELTGRGISAFGTLPTIRTTGETPYQVGEIRSVLTYEGDARQRTD